MTHTSKSVKNSKGKEKTQDVYFPPHFLFHFGPWKVQELLTGCVNHDGKHLSRFWTLCPILWRSRPKAHLCVGRKAVGSGLFGAGRQHGCLAGNNVGVNVTCHWEGIKGYGSKRWPPCPLSLADCVQLWAPLWTNLFAYVWQQLQEAPQAKRSGLV